MNVVLEGFALICTSGRLRFRKTCLLLSYEWRHLVQPLLGADGWGGFQNGVGCPC